MGILLSWLSNPDIPVDEWNKFLDNFSWFVCALVLACVALILARYRMKAGQRVVHFPAHVFADYEPMKTLRWAFLGGAIAAILFFVQSDNVLQHGHYLFRLGFSAELFFLISGFCYLIGWLCIAYIDTLTPAKFRYRPAPFRYTRKVAGD